MTTTASSSKLNLAAPNVARNLSVAALIEESLCNGEGSLASNGAFVARTGDRTGRSPKQKYLEDTPDVHESIWWGSVNQPVSADVFEELQRIATSHLQTVEKLYVFDGYVGADPERRLKVTTVTEQAWHSLFAQTLFIRPPADELVDFQADWKVLNAGRRRLTAEEQRIPPKIKQA